MYFLLLFTDIFLLCALRTPWANPKKHGNVPMSRSGENTAYIGSAVLFFTCKCHVFLMVFIYKTHVTITKFSN